MRTHGSKLQRESIRRAPRKQLEPVFEVDINCLVDFVFVLTLAGKLILGLVIAGELGAKTY
uniref:Uncharacterized protein n=1 Tax=Rhizophora mucronata TaxID=61149 RepID=A0A2P2MCL7_RHIMU